MNPDTIYYIIIVGGALLWPLVKLLAQSVYTRFESRLPANQQDMLERYAKMAVQYVEQSVLADGHEKKNRAIDLTQKLLLAAKLPIPNMAILNAAIEAAVLVLNREKQS